MDIEKLKEKILYFNKCYEIGKPVVDDITYDFYKKQLKILEIKNKIPTNQKISNIIGYVANQTDKHFEKILSLDHDFGKESIKKFITRMEKKINPWPLVAEIKIDGLSVIVRYENGILIKIATRGDGYYGEDITYLKQYINLPDHIDIKDKIEIRFEAFLEKEINTNSRNIVAGLMLKQTYDPKFHDIKFAPHNLYGKNDICNTYQELRKIFKNLNLNPIEHYAVCNNIEEAYEFYDKINNQRKFLNCDIDGIVFKVNDKDKEKILGCTSSFPKFAFAIKFENSYAISKINDIQYNISRNGMLIPLAVFEPVNINGKNIKNATLHNIEDLISKKYCIDDVIKVEMAGEVIPKISAIIEKSENITNIPGLCPSCKSKLINYQCMQNWNCIEQKIQKLIYFVSKHCFDIKNFSVSQIKYFVENDLINYPNDIFKLKNKINLIKNNPSWLSEKTWNTLMNNIEESKNINDANFYTSLGLPHIARNKAILISQKMSIVEFINSKELDLQFLGDKIAKEVFAYKEKEKFWISDLYNVINQKSNDEKFSLFD